MPNFFEKLFDQGKENPKPPEQIKKEKALKLAEEIKKIKERMEKEGETIEDYQSIIKIAQKIEKIYEEKREFISEKAREIYQSLKKTPLWDKEKKQWNWQMDKGGELKDSDRHSKDQLLGVLVEAVVEKGEEFVEFLTKGNK